MKDAEEKKGIKVNDHRRFDSAGNDRGEDSSEAPKPGIVLQSHREQPNREPQLNREPQKPSVAAQSQPKLEAVKSGVISDQPQNEDEHSEIRFSSFLISLATQALMQMGEVPPPEGVDLPPDRAAAKQTIDLIAMLEKKTKGNLDGDETQLMTEVLHNLRLCYIRKN